MDQEEVAAAIVYGETSIQCQCLAIGPSMQLNNTRRGIQRGSIALEVNGSVDLEKLHAAPSYYSHIPVSSAASVEETNVGIRSQRTQ